MAKKGHDVTVWRPKSFFNILPLGQSVKKYLGYIDQYIIFPIVVRNRLKSLPQDTLFVFVGHALGPWVPLVKNRPHVIHCHDFLAQLSAEGKIPENKTGWSGRVYQSYIRRGYSAGKHFISVSNKTKQDLHDKLSHPPKISTVIYNAIDSAFQYSDAQAARETLSTTFGIDLKRGYILHVGGNQWYKNRLGVIEIYNAWRKGTTSALPLLLIGETPNELLKKAKGNSSFNNEIYFITSCSDQQVNLAYNGASVLLFPSLAEGFGWPIAEAMASGCPVITTGEDPMTEVAADAAFLIPKMPEKETEVEHWAKLAGKTLNTVVTLPAPERRALVEAGFLNVTRFDFEILINKTEKVYNLIIQNKKTDVEFSVEPPPHNLLKISLWSKP